MGFANRFKPFGFLPTLLAAFALLAIGMAAPAQARYASIVIDADSGEVLHAVNANTPNYPASLTKLMTLYLAFDALKQGKARLSDRVEFSENAEAQAPSKLGLRTGQSISLEQAILALVTKSANDVAVALAEHLAGTEEEFARRMTARARQLGMSRTTFVNASGLPDGEQMSTARDMATLGRALLRNHPDRYHYFKVRQFTFAGQTFSTHNRLMLTYKGADGMKTGYIRASGFNLVTSASRNGRRLIGVVFGGNTAAQRDRHMAGLLDKGFASKKGATVHHAKHTVESYENADDQDEAVIEQAEVPAKAPPVKTALAQPANGKKTKADKSRAKPTPQDEAVGDADSSSWGVQVGAFGRYAAAFQAASEAQRQLVGTVPHGRVAVLNGRGNGQTLYRARLVGITESQARAACKALGKAKSACQIVAPEGTVSAIKTSG
ncbi:MAG: D-alanyl-D-alanine carboxypeptidase [Rhodospirillales bacterium]|nr:D-alanyl-D-alanine carboxypeptidase [Rhodospirillales bacterium]